MIGAAAATPASRHGAAAATRRLRPSVTKEEEEEGAELPAMTMAAVGVIDAPAVRERRQRLRGASHRGRFPPRAHAALSVVLVRAAAQTTRRLRSPGERPPPAASSLGFCLLPGTPGDPCRRQRLGAGEPTGEIEGRPRDWHLPSPGPAELGYVQSTEKSGGKKQSRDAGRGSSWGREAAVAGALLKVYTRPLPVVIHTRHYTVGPRCPPAARAAPG